MSSCMRLPSLLLVLVISCALVAAVSVSAHRLDRLRQPPANALEPLASPLPMEHEIAQHEHVLVEAEAVTDLAAAMSVPAPDTSISTHCVQMGQSCNMQVLRQAVEGWLEKDNNRGIFVSQKNRRLMSNRQGENAVIDQDVAAAMAELATSPRLISKVIGAEGTPDKPAQTSRFTYTYGTFGELTEVTGPIVRGPGTGAQADFWIKTVHRVVFGFEKPDRIEQGHIVAASLGGSNTSPHNFFPQTGASNRGPYNDIETRALKLVEKDTAQKVEGCTRIKITFDYNGGNKWIATEGTYTLEKNFRASCWDQGVNNGQDNWVQEGLPISWTNRPATFNVVVPSLTASNTNYQVTFSPQYAVPKNGLALTVTATSGGNALTLTSLNANNCVLTWTQGQTSVDTKTCTLKTPVNAGDVILSYVLAPNADNHWFDPPAPLTVPMPYFSLPPAPKMKRGETKTYKITLVRPQGSDIFQNLNHGNGELKLTPQSLVQGVVFNPLSISWKGPSQNDQEFQITLPNTASDTTRISFAVSGSGAQYIGVPQPIDIILPTITTSFNKGSYSKNEQITLTMKRSAGSANVNVNVAVRGTGVSYSFTLSGDFKQNQAFTFNAPGANGAYNVDFTLSGPGATTFAQPAPQPFMVA